LSRRVVLGVDPGTARCGWGVVAEEEGVLSAVGFGCLSTPASLGQVERLLRIHQGLTELLIRYAPDEVAVEQLFFNRNVTSALSVGEARGVALLAAGQQGLPVGEYTPSQVKEALTGSGRASKDELRMVVVMTLGLESPPRPDDVSDALGIALTHIFHRQLSLT
jgi:crossover junction endodeoxyribonuclease RuvC